MNSKWDDLWPTPEPPEDFALMVVVKSLETRSRTRKPLRLLWAALVPSLCVGLAFVQHQNESIKRAAVLEAQRKETEEQLRRLQIDFELAAQRERELQVSLANAKDEATRAKLQAELDQQRSKATAAVRAVPGGATWSPAAKAGAKGISGAPKKSKNCNSGDPLCD
jgi:hypothetical protein